MQDELFCYEAKREFSQVLNFIIGSNLYKSTNNLNRHLSINSNKVNFIHDQRYSHIFIFPYDQSFFKFFIQNLKSNDDIIIIWKKYPFIPVFLFRKYLINHRLKKINFAYVIPNWDNISHLISINGDAANTFYSSRNFNDSKSILLKILRQIAYFTRLIRFRDRAIICWAKVS